MPCPIIFALYKASYMTLSGISSKPLSTPLTCVYWDEHQSLRSRARVVRTRSQSKPHRSLLDDRLRKNRVPHALHSVFGPAHQAFCVTSHNFAGGALSAEHLALSGVAHLWDQYATVGCL